MSRACILVTGAAGGTQGGTGRLVAETLLRQGRHVRAFVRRRDQRSEGLERLGAEVFVGDLLDFRSVRDASAGVGAVYFAYPVQAGLPEATANMAVAAREAGVERLVNLVMLTSAPDAPTPRMRLNHLSEQVLDWADIGAVHIRAAVFYENLYGLVRATVAGADVVRLPWGDDSTIVPLVGAEDVARVAAGLLVARDLPPGSRHPMVAAAPALRDIVATFSRVLARDIRYENLSDEAWRQWARDDGINDHAVDHLSHLWRFLRTQPAAASARRFQTSAETWERFGRPDPVTFEDFLIGRRETMAGNL